MAQTLRMPGGRKGSRATKAAPKYEGVARVCARRNIRASLSIEDDQGGLMEKWECLVCGYIYDPEEGDPTQGIEPGTPFEELPEDWVCPDCGVGVDMFEKL